MDQQPTLGLMLYALPLLNEQREITLHGDERAILLKAQCREPAHTFGRPMSSRLNGESRILSLVGDQRR